MKNPLKNLFGKKEKISEQWPSEEKVDREVIGQWNILTFYSMEKDPKRSETVFKMIAEESEDCTVILMDYNQREQIQGSENVGFIYTDFIYTDELIGDAGSTVCTILDKIKNYLGNFEYFYDVDGNFHFQEIKNYLNTTQAKVDLEKINKDNYVADMSKGKTVYKFDNSNLITSFSNTPQFNMIKNDFVV